MSASLGDAHAHDKSDVVLGLVEFLLDDLRIASMLVDVLYLSECGTHRGADHHVRLAVLDEFADL